MKYELNKSLIIKIIILLSIIVLFVVINRTINFQMVTEESALQYVFGIENLQEKDNEFVVNGYCFNPQIDLKSLDMNELKVVLRERESGKYIYLATDIVERMDVNQYYKCEYDYSFSGFIADINCRKLKKNKIYDIYIRYKQDERKVFNTGYSIIDSQLCLANAQDTIIPDLKNSGIEYVTEKGELCGCTDDSNVFVYYYQGYLYWIVDKDYGDSIMNKKIEYSLGTTQYNKLPEWRISSGYRNDDLNFSLIDYLIVNDSRYYVAARKIPNEYSVTNITTGVYDDGWVWKMVIRPNLVAEKY